MNKEKSLAQLKCDAASGNISFEMLEWHGKTGDDIPERLRGIREVAYVNTVAITLETADGQKSELRYPAAKLVSYDGDSLVIYDAKERPLSDLENTAWEEIQKLYKDNPNYSFWKIKAMREEIARKRDCPWIYADKKVHGKYHDYSKNVVRDDSMRGDAVLKYRIHHKEGEN